MSIHQVKMGTERSFGVVFTILFLGIALWPILSGGSLRLWALLIAGALLFLAFFIPKSLAVANKLWFKFGMLLGSIVTPIVMGLLFFFIIVPTGLFMKALGKDLLSQRIDKTAKSYWVLRKEPVGTMKNQY